METKNAISINFEALQKDKDGNSFVYVVENNRAAKRLIKTGTETEFDIQVIEGLKVEESYIKNPPASLKEGDRVRAAGVK
jgi:multidrug efflux pump subunit AcrA (membrane-fusion protein)